MCKFPKRSLISMSVEPMVCPGITPALILMSAMFCAPFIRLLFLWNPRPLQSGRLSSARGVSRKLQISAYPNVQSLIKRKISYLLKIERREATFHERGLFTVLRSNAQYGPFCGVFRQGPLSCCSCQPKIRGGYSNPAVIWRRRWITMAY